jgi:hypothetical protein
VDDPVDAPAAIFGLNFGPLGLVDIATVTKAATLNRGMTGEDVAKLGKNVGPAMDIVNKCIGMQKILALAARDYSENATVEVSAHAGTFILCICQTVQLP